MLIRKLSFVPVNLMMCTKECSQSHESGNSPVIFSVHLPCLKPYSLTQRHNSWHNSHMQQCRNDHTPSYRTASENSVRLNLAILNEVSVNSYHILGPMSSYKYPSPSIPSSRSHDTFILIDNNTVHQSSAKTTCSHINHIAHIANNTHIDHIIHIAPDLHIVPMSSPSISSCSSSSSLATIAVSDISLEMDIPPPPCVRCIGHANSSFDRNRLGTVAWLPKQANLSQQSVAHQQLNKEAFGHPCVIIAHSTCSHLVFCLQACSFGGRTIQQKYSTGRNVRRQLDSYLALRRRDTVPHNELGELDHTGSDMQKQTYVHLEYGYWIEYDTLTITGNRCLTPSSLSRAVELYYGAEMHRRRFGSDSNKRLRSRSPPTTPSPPPMAWRCPTFTPYVVPSITPIAPSITPTASPLFVTPARRNRAVQITVPPVAVV